MGRESHFIVKNIKHYILWPGGDSNKPFWPTSIFEVINYGFIHCSSLLICSTPWDGIDVDMNLKRNVNSNRSIKLNNEHHVTSAERYKNILLAVLLQCKF